MSIILAGTDLIFREVNPCGVTEADIVILIPSYKEAENIDLPTKKADLGLTKYYSHLKTAIINCDNCSEDGTEEAFLRAEGCVPRIHLSSPPGVRGKGANLVNGFRRAAALSPKVVVVLDANLLSIKSGWIKRLADPILTGKAEYVSPIYVRHKYDGPISRGLAGPFMRMLFGRRVLQPIHVDHSFSGRLNEIYLQSDWELDDRGYRSDLNMLARAIMNNAPICQSFMAYPRTTTLKKLDFDLPKAFSYVATALFQLMIDTAGFWTALTRTRPTILSCADETPLMPPPQVEVDRDYLINGFVELGRQQRNIWEEFLPPDLCAFLDRQLAAAADGGAPQMPVDLWRDIIVEAALAFKTADDDKRAAITLSLAPVFFIKGLTVYFDSADMTERQYNALLEEEARSFECAKKELTARWKMSDQS